MKRGMDLRLKVINQRVQGFAPDRVVAASKGLDPREAYPTGYPPPTFLASLNSYG